MKNQAEVRETFKRGLPVIYDGIEYLYISAIIYRRGGPGGMYTQLELMDRNRRDVVIASPERVTMKEGDDGTGK